MSVKRLPNDLLVVTHDKDLECYEVQMGMWTQCHGHRVNKGPTVADMRDQFAMAALTGLLSVDDTRNHTNIERIIADAWWIADHMLERRNRMRSIPTDRL